VRLETKGRGGKAVTTIQGLLLTIDELAALGKQLRTACGTGGTCKQGELELQGDHVDKVLVLLQQRGYRAKRTGG
jgi:translation initiation factor 1